LTVPTCGRCGNPHYNFVACASAQAKAEVAKEAQFGGNQIPLSSVLTNIPEGMRPSVGWGKPDGWGQGWGGVKRAA
jgi:hypothetical protein